MLILWKDALSKNERNTNFNLMFNDYIFNKIIEIYWIYWRLHTNNNDWFLNFFSLLKCPFYILNKLIKKLLSTQIILFLSITSLNFIVANPSYDFNFFQSYIFLFHESKLIWKYFFNSYWNVKITFEMKEIILTLM